MNNKSKPPAETVVRLSKKSHFRGFFDIVEAGDKNADEGSKATAGSGNAMYGYAGAKGSSAKKNRRGSGL
jgi:hypothetical protein